MYYLVFGAVYLLSLLPFWCLYRLSDLAYFILYHLSGYRKGIVMQNLQNAFPEKSLAEQNAICRAFYRNFCDVWFEMLKMMSLSRKQIAKRMSYDYSVLEAMYKTGKAVQGYTGHFINWEWASVSVAVNQPYAVLCVYMPLSNPAMERLILYMRQRFGAVFLKAGNMKNEMESWNNRQYVLGLVADQSPGSPVDANWAYFMNRPAGFVKRPWQKARLLNTPTVYLKVSKRKRGHYHFEAVLFENEPALLSEEALALKYKTMLEADIRANPEIYLWTHRRWKLPWKSDYQKLWIDEKPSPLENTAPISAPN
jgi:KDO2-lipid IV(A) lauroyltransferase